MSYIAIPEALAAMEKNLAAIIELSGKKVQYVQAKADSVTGTASISHSEYNNAISCVVHFPVLNYNDKLSKEEIDRWTGYFLHEISHALFTDANAWRIAVGEGLHRLVNGMEDVRIERLLVKSDVAANAQDLLEDLINWAINKAGSKCNPNDGKQLPWTLAAIGRARLNGYGNGNDYYAMLSPQMKATIDAALAKLNVAKDTFDVLEIARSLCGRNPETGQAPQGQEGKAPEGEEGEAGKGEGEASEGEGEAVEGKGEGKASEGEGEASEGEGEASEGEGEGEGEEAQPEGLGTRGTGKGDESESKPGEPDEEAKKGEKQGPVGGNGAGTSGVLADFDPKTMEDVELDPVSDQTKKASKNITKNYEKTARAIQITTVMRDAIKHAGKGISSLPPGPTLAGRIIGEATRCSRLRQQIARVLKAVENEAYSRRRSTGRLDRFATGRVASGMFDNPFAKRTISEGYESEAIVLCDGSSSMGQAKLTATATLATIIAQAAQQVGVKCQIVQFVEQSLREVKGTKDRISSNAVLKRIDRLSRWSDGSTPLSSSLATVAMMLKKRAPTKRKFIFAITDGGCDMGRDTVRAVADWIELQDVELIGLSIDSPCHGAFKHEAMVSTYNGQDVSKVGLDLVVRALEARAPR